MALSFKFSTVAQLRARLREEFRTSRGVRLHRLAAWADANLTNNQLASLFGLTAPEAVALRTRLTTMRSRIEACDAEVGQ